MSSRKESELVTEAPYTFDGHAYLRHGPTKVVMPRDQYEWRLVQRLHATRRWENEPVPDGVGIDDLDEAEIQITLDNAIRLGRLEAPRRHWTMCQLPVG